MPLALSGVFTALVTPFKDGEVDEEAFVRLVQAQAEAGVDGVVPVGTTGESPTLSFDEHLRVVELAVTAAKDHHRKTLVIAGTGSNSTQEAIELSQGAEKRGADALLLVAPYYNKPTQEGLFRHFCAIADAVRIPIVLYSIPGRCGIEIAVETVARLAQARPNIVAIKESGGAVERVSQLRRAVPDSFVILSGDDSLTLPFLAAGAAGVISVASHLIPKELGDMVRLFRSGQVAEAEAIHRRFYPLFRDLFVESNPVPVKAALARRGVMSEEVRLPLVTLADRSRSLLGATLDSLNL